MSVFRISAPQGCLGCFTKWTFSSKAEAIAAVIAGLEKEKKTFTQEEEGNNVLFKNEFGGVMVTILQQ